MYATIYLFFSKKDGHGIITKADNGELLQNVHVNDTNAIHIRW